MRIKWQIVAVVLLVGLYLTTRLWRLTYLPVFADEAIYLRWSQLIISDPKQYLFFSMNDGKTPLQIWLNVPFLLLFSDPLWAGRLVTVLVGLGQMAVVAALVKNFGGGRRTAILGAGLVLILPGWFLHGRLALLDALMTLWLSLSLLFIKKTVDQLSWTGLKKNWRRILCLAGLAGVFFGAALWTKFAALIFLPVMLFIGIVLSPEKKCRIGAVDWWKENFLVVAAMGLAGAVGGIIFLSLKFTPVFSQIFARGGDFLYPSSVLLSSEIWSIVARNSSNFLAFLANYASWPFLAGTLILSVLVWKKNRQPLYLLLGGLIFLLPMILLGKVVYPRYLLPSLIFISLAGTLAMATWWRKWQKQWWLRWLPTVILLPTLLLSVNFMIKSTSDLARWPLVEADAAQYLATWSAGFGVPETVALIKNLSAQERVLVLTEGYFGTLPDALLMYFFKEDVSNLAIEGIGQPVVAIPQRELARFSEFDRIILVVNSNRMQLDTADKKLQLLASFDRPVADHSDGFIALQVWEIDRSYGQGLVGK